MAKEKIDGVRVNNLFIWVMIAQIIILPLAAAQGIETSVSSVKTDEKAVAGSFSRITPIDAAAPLVSQARSEKISLLIPTEVDIPIQGKIIHKNSSYTGPVEVCIESTCKYVNAVNGTFYASVPDVPIEDPHSLYTLTIAVNGSKVVNKTFYPAGAPQGDLTVNGNINVVGAGMTIGDISSSGSIKYSGDDDDFYGYTNSGGWQSLTNGSGSGPSSLWINQGSYIQPSIFNNLKNLVITSSNRLGIGTTAPLAPLHVIGAAIFKGPTTSASVPGALVYDSMANCYKFYNGTEWVPIPSGTISYNGTLWQQNGTDIYYTAGYVGIGTTTPEAELDVEVISGGAATIGSSNNSATGDFATAMGQNTTAIGDGSIAAGYDTTALGDYSTASGYNTNASGDYSTAIGYSTTALGEAATAMGAYTSASGELSTAMGYNTTAVGDYSTAMGKNTSAQGDNSVAMGQNIIVNQSNTLGVGGDIYATGNVNATDVCTTAGKCLSTVGGWSGEDDGDWAINGSDVYRSGGKVGIGTATPTSLLTLEGDTHADLYLYGSDLANIQIGSTLTNTADLSLVGTTSRISLSDGAGTYYWGIRSSNNDLLIEDSVGSGILAITQSGNVGIGTTSPNTALEVIGTINATDVCTAAGKCLNGLTGGTGDGTGGWAETATNTTTMLNVGIGVENPSGVLHTVAPNADLIPLFQRNAVSDNARVFGARYKSVTTADMVDGFGVGIVMAIQDNESAANDIAQIAARRDGADNSGALTFITYNPANPAFADPTGANEQMRIDKDGYVGIGTTAPNQRLHINGSGYEKVNIETTNDTGFAQIQFTKPLQKWAVGATDITDDFIIYSMPEDGDHLNAMTINRTTGNVGIGTTTPQSKLDVNGTINATDVCIPGKCLSTVTGGTGGDDGDWVINGSDVYRSSGKVGIGGAPDVTTYPELNAGLKLYVHEGDIVATEPADTTNPDLKGADIMAVDKNGLGIDLFAQDGMGYIKTMNAGMDLMLGAGHWNANQLVLQAGGNVGIGTGVPSAKLDVEVSSGGAATIGSSGNSATGDYAIAMGYDATASGNYSTAMGNNTKASGYSSTAMGDNTEATRSYSTAMGYKTKAAGYYSTAIGLNTSASEYASTAMGLSTNALEQGSTAMGYGTNASGWYSTAMGMFTSASGDASTAMGRDTNASGHYSTAMGRQTTASEWYSTAIGYNTTASGESSTAIGSNIESGGYGSIAIGLNPDQDNGIITQNNTMAIMGGNVGIGTSSPYDMLTVSSPSSGAIIRLDNSAANPIRSWRLLSNNPNGAFAIRDETKAAHRLVIDTQGNVGIGTGTSIPSAKLNVVTSDGDDFQSGTAAIFENGGYGDGVVQIILKAKNTTKNPSWTENNKFIRSEFGRLEFGRYSDDMSPEVMSSSVQMAIDKEGKVGIGVNEPTQKLEIADNNAIKLGDAMISSGEWDGKPLAHLSNGPWYKGISKTDNNWTVDHNGSLIQLYDQYIQFYKVTYNSSNISNHKFDTTMIIDPNGNVGLGLGSPKVSSESGTVLTINGENATGGPDRGRLELVDGRDYSQQFAGGMINFIGTNSSGQLVNHAIIYDQFTGTGQGRLTMGSAGNASTVYIKNLLKADQVINPADQGDVQIVLQAVNQSIDESGNSIAEGNNKFVRSERGRLELGRYTDNMGSSNSQLAIANNGNVGIGTGMITPGRELHIHSGNGAQIRLEGTGSADWEGIEMMGNGSQAYTGLNEPYNYFFIDMGSNGDDLVITQNGSVGIGTTNPSNTKVHITGGATLLMLENTQTTDVGQIIIGSNQGATDGTDGKYKFIRSENGRLEFGYYTDDRGSSSPQVSIDNSGNVGIGTITPGAYRLYVNGDAIAAKWDVTSDARFKENVKPVDSALDKISEIEGVTFTWKPTEGKAFDNKTHYGIIAQDIEKVLPEVVSTASDGEKSVAYSEIIPVLVEAVKELKAENAQLKQEIEDIKNSKE